MYHLVRCLFSGAPEKVEKVSGDNEGGRKEGTISRGARRANNRTKTPYTNDTFLHFYINLTLSYTCTNGQQQKKDTFKR